MLPEVTIRSSLPPKITICDASRADLVPWNSPPDLPDQANLPDQAKVVAASAPQTLPSTRAGGQDDVT